ncbi:flagellar assembly protein FliW [Aminobacterium mobile]|jgi:flagellar assembly factor FliW|uniref:flagellar assembly protein FliW n=1 Tax=Aminobacterium mobile TaxID=81467 RepID=UPI00046450D3|nr:flagellar assembly protein FliW [Aminobacterium mobile]
MTRVLETTRFGRLEVTSEAVVYFPKGLPGFEDHYEWVVAGEDENPIKWLQSVKDEDVALPVVSPLLIEKNYDPALSSEDLEALGGDAHKLTVMVVVTVPPAAPWDMTANLRAPIVVNHEERMAKQVISGNEAYEVRTPVLPQSVRDLMRKQAVGGES